MVRHIGCLLFGLALAWTPRSHAHLIPRWFQLERYNRQLSGKILDYSHNHGTDRRLFYPSLGKKRDLYVYVPPGYDPGKRYPVAIYLHGFLSDEMSFLGDILIPMDRAIGSGKLPPMVIVAPDASVHGVDCLATYGTFYCNSKQGRFEDYLVCDVYDWVLKNFSIREEPEAHVLLGVSMGGHGAFSKAMKHPDKFRVAVGVMPPLNVLYTSCRDRYMDNFDPCCWKQRETLDRPRQVIGRFYGVIVIREGRLLHPLYGRNNPDVVALVKEDNPIDLLESRNVQPGQFEFYVGYAGKDEFNLDAQAESFLLRARQRNIPIHVNYIPDGRHNVKTGKMFLPEIFTWLTEKVGPYAPQ